MTRRYFPNGHPHASSLAGGISESLLTLHYSMPNRKGLHLHSCEDGSDTLASADAHRHQHILAARTAEFVERLHRQNAARCANRVTKRNATTIGVGAVQRQVQIA